MSNQNFKNHAKMVPGYHYIALPGLLLLFIGAIWNVTTCTQGNYLSASLLLLISFIMILFSWYIRSFALKAQDRAIRAEENFRHYILTNKPLPSGLTVQQIIALRFASDAEFSDLAIKAVSENLSNKQIKLEIKNWKEDNDRV